MPQYKGAGADAAGKYDEAFRKIIANDPDVQAVIQRVWGAGPRPSDTPKHLEKANAAASKEIEQILKAKGIELPDRTFINPRSGTIEGHRGWSGLNNWQRAAIIAAAAAGGVGAGMLLAGGGAAAAGAGGGAAASGAGTGGGLAAMGITPGVGAGFASTVPVALTPTLSAGTLGSLGAASGGSALGTMLTNAGINAATTKAKGGSWKDALVSGGIGAASGGFSGGNMDWSSILKNYGKDVATNAGSSLIQQLLSGDSLAAAGKGVGAIGQTQAHNRGVVLDAMMAGDEMKLAADRERRAAESDLLKKIQTTSYLKSGGFKDTGPGTSVSGKPLGRFDFGVRPPTEAEVTAATELEGQVMNRLRNPIKLSNYESKMEPGKMETTLNWLGPILSTLGAARGAGRYAGPTLTPTAGGMIPEAPTQIPQTLPIFTPAAVNPAGGNPWSKVKFGDKVLGE